MSTGGKIGRARAKRGGEAWVLPTHQRRSRRKLDRLLKAGERVFAARGFADAHVSEIARLAGCSIGSFYRRFKDKQALFLALQADMYDRAEENIEDYFASPECKTASLTKVCFQLVQNCAHEAESLEGYYRASLEIGLRSHKVWKGLRALERFHAEQLQKLLLRRNVRALRSDFVPAVSLAFRIVVGNQVGLMVHGPGPFEFSDTASTSEFTRILMAVAQIKLDEGELRRLRNRHAPRRTSRRVNRQ